MRNKVYNTLDQDMLNHKDIAEGLDYVWIT